MKVKCKICSKFEQNPKAKWAPGWYGPNHPFYDKSNWANWVVFQVCPSCFAKMEKKQCKRCMKSGKLCKMLENEPYCSWCCVVDLGTCALCGKRDITIPSFKDALSFKEWKISTTCQECQDKVFN